MHISINRSPNKPRLFVSSEIATKMSDPQSSEIWCAASLASILEIFSWTYSLKYRWLIFTPSVIRYRSLVSPRNRPNIRGLMIKMLMPLALRFKRFLLDLTTCVINRSIQEFVIFALMSELWWWWQMKPIIQVKRVALDLTGYNTDERHQKFGSFVFPECRHLPQCQSFYCQNFDDDDKWRQ